MIGSQYAAEAWSRIERYGVFIQGVTASHPLDVGYQYSTGFQMLDPPLPEVIVFGLHPDAGAGLINRVFQQTRTGNLCLTPGAVLGPLPRFDPSLRVRVDRVRPELVEEYAPVSARLLGVDGPLPFVQLVLPDADGGWPDVDDAGPARQGWQPLLSNKPAWPAIMHLPEEDAFLDHADGDVLVAVPVYALGRPEERHELLRAVRVGRERAVVGQVPYAADHLAYGDLIAIQPHDGRAGVPTDALIGGAVLEPGGFTTLVYGWQPTGPDPIADIEQLYAVLDVLGTHQERARVATTRRSVHINSRRPDEVRATLRPFVRDGLLAELEPRSDPASTCTVGCGCSQDPLT